MYDKLIKSLRVEPFEVESVGLAKKMNEAADAIEELQQIAGHYEETAKDYFKDVCYYLERVPKWVPVTERLPEYGERVLVFGGVTMYVAYYDKNRYGGESWHKLNSKSHYCNPTHWMPLPEPPKEE